jgi:fibronectin-binding autotransporter adhesin
LGHQPGSTGTATITGPGSRWTSNYSLNVGYSGAGQLRVEAGGQVSTPVGYLGANPGSTVTATITGPGSTWTASKELYVGNSGSGALTVEDGGHVSSETLYASLGDLHGNGTIAATIGAVLDADLQFNAAHPAQDVLEFGEGGTLTVTAGGGYLGAGFKGLGSLTISEGVAVSGTAGYLGHNAGSTGTATITDPGSRWAISHSFLVGYSGSGALQVKAGGQVSNIYGYLGFADGSMGTATITGAGSKWANSDELYVGRAGSGSLHVEAGGQVNNTTGYLGYNAGTTGSATITGPGSKWTNVTELYVGRDGSGSLTVEDGGHVSAGTLYASLGDLHGDGTIESTRGAVLDADLQFNAASPVQAAVGFGAGGILTVTAAGGSLGAGYKGLGSLTVSEGAAVSSSFGYLGYNTGSTGTATITGAGSKWTNSTGLYVGNSGSGALRVEAGGQVSNSTNYLGFNSDSTGTATITGAGSKWANSTLYVGNSGNGQLRVGAGGLVSGSTSYMGYNGGSAGEATIIGAEAKWTNSGNLFVGRTGSGALTVAAGGLVSVRGRLTIDSNGGGESFVNISSGGMLALWGDADDSLTQFLGLVAGTDAIRYWSAGLAEWAPLTAATLGVDYTLQYQNAGDLTGYTLLTVLAPGPPGDFNFDGQVDGADLLAWQRGDSPTPGSSADLATWRASYGLGATTPAAAAVPEPEALALVGLAAANALLRRRSPRGRSRSRTMG